MNESRWWRGEENRLKLTGHVIEMEFGTLKHIPRADPEIYLSRWGLHPSGCPATGDLWLKVKHVADAEVPSAQLYLWLIQQKRAKTRSSLLPIFPWFIPCMLPCYNRITVLVLDLVPPLNMRCLSSHPGWSRPTSRQCHFWLLCHSTQMVSFVVNFFPFPFLPSGFQEAPLLDFYCCRISHPKLSGFKPYLLNINCH